MYVVSVGTTSAAHCNRQRQPRSCETVRLQRADLSAGRVSVAADAPCWRTQSAAKRETARAVPRARAPLAHEVAAASSMHATGLVNLGNTCNLNAAAQLLAHCAPFSAALMANPSSLAGSDKDATLSRAVAQLCSALHERGRARAPLPPARGAARHLDALSPAGAEAECMVMSECQPPTRRPEFRPPPLGPRAHSRAH